MNDRTFIALMGAVPKNLLSRIAGTLTRWEAPRWLLERAITGFAGRYGLDLDECDPPSSFRTFGEFFARPLKPGRRPIAPGEEVVVSPVDAVVSEAGTAGACRLVQAKGIDYTVGALLGDYEAAGRFEGGAWATLYLSPRDYHRIHFPLGGRVTGWRYAPGRLWPVNPASVRTVPSLFAIRSDALPVAPRLPPDPLPARRAGHGLAVRAGQALARQPRLGAHGPVPLRDQIGRSTCRPATTTGSTSRSAGGSRAGGTRRAGSGPSTPPRCARSRPSSRSDRTLYLSPRDYHRIHFPLGGRVTGWRYAPGRLWPVNPASVRTVPSLFAINERLVVHLDTPLGGCAVVAVGATVVGRVRASFDASVPPTNLPGAVMQHARYAEPIPVEKGGELGAFEMGSTVVLLFERGRAVLRLEQGQRVKVGEAIGGRG